MIRLTCPGCQSKLNAKAQLAGQTRKCPKCGTPVEIPESATEPEVGVEDAIALDDALPDQHVHGVVEEHLARVETLRHLERLNRYWIVDKTKIVAMWESDGQGWMLKTSTGPVPAKRNIDELPAHGSFTLVELIMSMSDQGIKLTGIRSYRLAERWALPSIGHSDEKILTHIKGPGCLDREQKNVIWNQIKSQFMPGVWQSSQNVRDYLSNTDYLSPGTE